MTDTDDDLKCVSGILRGVTQPFTHFVVGHPIDLPLTCPSVLLLVGCVSHGFVSASGRFGDTLCAAWLCLGRSCDTRRKFGANEDTWVIRARSTPLSRVRMWIM